MGNLGEGRNSHISSKSNVTGQRLFFDQKYMVFLAKWLISMVGIRFGGGRDELLTFMQYLGVITPPYKDIKNAYL